MIPLPKTSEDIIRAVISAGIVGGAIYIQATTNEIPVWLTTAVTAVITYYIGFRSNNGSSKDVTE